MKVLLAYVVLVAGVGLAAQEPQAPSLALAQAPGSWVVEIATTGGFTGRGRGSLAVASDGMTRCAGPTTCPAQVAIDTVASITALVAGLRTAAWDITASEDTCRDCYRTTMIVRTRHGDGSEARSVFTWTDVTLAKAPEDVRRIYNTAIRLAH